MDARLWFMLVLSAAAGAALYTFREAILEAIRRWPWGGGGGMSGGNPPPAGPAIAADPFSFGRKRKASPERTPGLS